MTIALYTHKTRHVEAVCTARAVGRVDMLGRFEARVDELPELEQRRNDLDMRAAHAPSALRPSREQVAHGTLLRGVRSLANGRESGGRGRRYLRIHRPDDFN